MYRIEHRESGLGPYTHSTPGRFASDAMACISEPSDMGYSGQGYHHFAFISVRAMAMAIDRYALLNEFGFMIQTYTANECIIFPDGQVAFRKETAELITSVPVKEFDFYKRSRK